MSKVDFAVTGAGIIGLSLALELHKRGASVAILDTAKATSGASTAAAGMLAADDPHNPAELHDLSTYSASLYDVFLSHISALSGLSVPYQTDTTIQYLHDGSVVTLAERSVDPRQVAAAALNAVRSTDIALHELCEEVRIEETSRDVLLHSSTGVRIVADRTVHATGAWFGRNLIAGMSQINVPIVRPRKGQMLRVQIPSDCNFRQVHRSAGLYIVPRTEGPQAGTAVIGATDEDAGFDLSVRQSELNRLRQAAAEMVPALASAIDSPQIEAWAGLRPATPDLLPLLGALPGTARQWVATGHYRNGILLAPGTAAVIADCLVGRQPSVDLHRFSPARFLESFAQIRPQQPIFG